MIRNTDQRAQLGRRGVLIAGIGLAASGCVAASPLRRDADALSLAASVARYAGFGDQRTGGPADSAVADWLAQELQTRGVPTRRDRFALNQLTDPSAHLAVGGQSYEAFPQWRFPTPASGLRLQGPLKAISDQDLRGAVALATDPIQPAAYWPAASDAPVLDAAQRGAVALVVAPRSPNGGLFAYNRDADDPDFPIPVVIVRPGDLAALRVGIGSEAVVTTTSPSRLVETSNVIGTLASRGGDRRRLVISTPRSGWFRCGAERGGGIALWIALAGFAARRLTCATTLIASTGHEIGHVGMKRFMSQDAPPPSEATLWIHLGASIAARRSGYPTPVPSAQQVFLPGGADDPYATAFAAIGYTVSPSEPASPGETGDIAERGYAPLIGFAGHHPSFHTPDDDGAAVDPDILDAVRTRLEAILLDRFG